MIIDDLIEQIRKKNNPSVIGLDTHLDYLPVEMRAGIARELPMRTIPPFGGWQVVIDKDRLKNAIWTYNKQIIDAIYDIVPAIKVQLAYYEMYGVEGIQALSQTIQYAKEKDLIVIVDGKRNDIGATATCYANAYLGKTNINELEYKVFDGDFLTVNAYLGSDGIRPFLKCMEEEKKGIFVLVKTSNLSSGELQDLRLENQLTVYEYMGQMVEKWGENFIGQYGYSSVGAVVGATYPKQAATLRQQMQHTFFLIPGYGAQGGKATDIQTCFDKNGLGGIVNSSRGILCAYQQEEYIGKSFDIAAREACIAMQKDLTSVIKIK